MTFKINYATHITSISIEHDEIIIKDFFGKKFATTCDDGNLFCDKKQC